MGWERKHFEYTTLGKDKTKRGYRYKLCPYSCQYRDTYKYTGEFCVGLDSSGVTIKEVGTFVLGNSVNTSFLGVPYDSYICSDHTTTSGRMIPTQNPPGWTCDDPNCYYYTTVAVGQQYREA